MPAKLLQRVLDLAIVILILLWLLVLVRDLAGPGGSRHVVQIAPPATEPFGTTASLALDRATLAVDAGMPLVVVNAAVALLGLALLVLALLALRRLLGRFATGEMFVEENVADMRRIGIALLAAAGLSIGAEIVIQAMILGAVAPPDGAVLHPSLSWSVKGMRNLWLDYRVPLDSIVVGGFALLLAQAFRAGLDYRRDSEGVL